MNSNDVEPVGPGDAVKIVTEDYEERTALVTIVHGEFGQGFVPCINVAYIASDPAQRDPYGHQVVRMSSLQHLSQGPANMDRPGRYWINA